MYILVINPPGDGWSVKKSSCMKPVRGAAKIGDHRCIGTVYRVLIPHSSFCMSLQMSDVQNVIKVSSAQIRFGLNAH